MEKQREKLRERDRIKREKKRNEKERKEGMTETGRVSVCERRKERENERDRWIVVVKKDSVEDRTFTEFQI